LKDDNDREFQALSEHMITFERSYLFIDNKSQIKVKEIENIYFLHFVKEDVKVL